MIVVSFPWLCVLLGEDHLFAVNQLAVGHEGVNIHASLEVTGGKGYLALAAPLCRYALELFALHVIDVDVGLCHVLRQSVADDGLAVPGVWGVLVEFG